MSAILFNLLVNATFSLLAGLLVVQIAIWVFRVETDRWKLALLTLPFLKMIVDFARGIPADSVLWTGLDPFSLPPRSQILYIGAGATGWAPFLNAGFWVRDPWGNEFTASVGDYLLIWIHRSLGAWVPSALLLIMIGVGLFFLTRRLREAWKFERRRRLDRSLSLRLPVASSLRRNVDVYVSPGFHGTPFTGGLFRPYICVPEVAWKKLDAGELNAVIAHEISHVAHLDLVFSVMIQLIGDLFWFVPGYQLLARKMDRLREVLADRSALRRGADATLLASALLKLRELSDDEPAPLLASAFLREKPLLKDRVHRLLGQTQEAPSRLGWQSLWVRWLIVIFIGLAVISSTFGGNHSIRSTVHNSKTTEAGVLFWC